VYSENFHTEPSRREGDCGSLYARKGTKLSKPAPVVKFKCVMHGIVRTRSASLVAAGV
jgi:hypothetical protein